LSERKPGTTRAKEITIKRDETVTLKTQTMDGGVTLEIKYE